MSVTKAEVLEKIEYLEEKSGVPLEYSSTEQGWYLVDARTFDRIGPICQTKPEFMRFMRGVDFGIRMGRDGY